MLKKIFIAAFMLTLVTAQNVSAREVSVYTEEYTGYNFRVITETILNRTEYRDNRTFDVVVRIYRNGNFDSEILYQMWENDGLTWYTNGEGTGMHPVNGVASAENIWNFCIKYLNLDYEVSYK